MLLLWMDDVLMVGNNWTKMEQLVVIELKGHFSVKILKSHQLNFVDLKITIISDGIYLNQRKLIDRVTERFNFTQAKTSQTPIYHSPILLPGKEHDGQILLPFQELIGSLLYIGN